MSRNRTFFNWCCVFTLLASTGYVEAVSRKPVVGKKGMAVAVEPIATKIAVDIMKKGGNAIDAAVALGFAMAVTSPSNANIGGGGFMVIRLADGSAIAVDYREKAPGKAHGNMYLDANGDRAVNSAITLTRRDVIDHGMTIQEAVDAPRIHHQWFPDRLNIEGGVSQEIIESLKAKGYTIRTSGFFSGSYRQGDGHSIMVDPKTGYLLGAPDPRIEGTAFGY